jgi:CBS domain-containing protein
LSRGPDIDSIIASDLIGKKLVVIDPEDTISNALGKMKKYDATELAVMKGENIVGVLSYSKLIKRRNLPLSTRVEHIMSIPPKIKATDKMTKIAEIFISTDYGSVPVIKGNRLEGFVTRRDVVSQVQNIESLSKMYAEEVMTDNPICVKEDDNVSKAMHLMRGLEEMTIPVVNKKGELKGLVSAKNLSEYLKRPRKGKSPRERGERKDLNIVVRSLMVSNVSTVTRSSQVKDIIDIMMNKNQANVIVLEEEIPVGIVTERDIIEALAGLGERKEVYVQISGLEESDPMVYEEMYTIIGKYLSRIGKIYTPKIFNAHVVHHHQPDDLTKYTVHSRLTMEKGSFTSQEYDWDLFQALDMSLEHIHKMVLKQHERTVTGRRGKKIR